MKITTKFLTYCIMAFAFVLTSCEGEDGAAGPQGPAGTDGQDGNANVVSVLFENQTINNGDNVFDIPQLTQEIYDTGIVYAYVTVTGNDYWEVLPLSLGQQIILEIDRIEVGRATLRATFTQSNLRLRFVLVEGNAASSVDFADFDEVQAYYGLD
ncbi:hypothetical protein [Aquimarina sp. 2201CG5-10]|uniref:hypothetical protein n=1 Tax=Aquimarina callyspongiae TaxID=3098150 RepID=UPI002AB4E187|nr:hypothetical protein [Aquimarina sp. 2201CG5-10]MDY8138755.1 hypothetical protein [Aquimarina sp. 2201CG5-10]